MNTGFDMEMLESELQNIFEINMEDFGFDIDSFEDDISDRPLDDDEIDENGEYEFTEYLGENTNYVILTFKNEMDWLNIQSVLDLKPVKSLSTRKDGTVNEKQQHIGIGRVVDGVEAINKIRREVQNEN